MKAFDIWNRFGLIVLAIIIFAFFSISTTQFLNITNILNILSQTAIFAIAGLGMTFAITIGGFDLSIGMLLTLVTVIIALLTPVLGFPISIIISLIFAVFCGLINGFFITKAKIQTFVATLATMVIFHGIALILSGGQAISLLRYPEVKIFATGSLFNIPISLIILAVVYIIGFLIFKYTPFGVYVRGIGSSIFSARASGIRVDRVIMLVFILTSVTAAISGILIMSQLQVGSAQYGGVFALEVITITILGGTDLRGGKGNLLGTLVAAFMIAMIKSGLNLFGIGLYYQQFTIGLFLILALSIGGIRLIFTSKE
jgi:ribose/xylose/arabinose/galactoside ABC-type transport system permease subunit